MKIAVIGHSCSGKTLLTNTLAKLYPDYIIFRADQYKGPDFETAAHPLLDQINRAGDRIICEGVQTAHLLRLGAETRSLFFDVVINCHTDEKTQMSRYITERDATKWRYIPSFNKSLDTVFMGYRNVVTAMNKAPVFLDYKT